jgi:hypothetical protein
VDNPPMAIAKTARNPGRLMTCADSRDRRHAD